VTITVGEILGWPAKADEGAEVGLAHQPSWPFECSVYASNPAVVAEAEEEGAVEASVVYLVEGSQLGYLPGDAMEACGC
jgi:hypothetical protein